MTPQVIVIAGSNGAGKTTSAPFLLRDSLNLREYINADPIALGLSSFDPSSVALPAGRIMLDRLHQLAAQRKSFAFETTLAARSHAGWIKGLALNGYQFQLMFLWLQSAELAVERVRQRVHLGGHDVPENVIRRRYEKGLKNFPKLYQPLADSWAVYDNSGTLSPRLIANGVRRDVSVVKHDDLWMNFPNACNQ